MIREPPYELNESGYAGFELPIEVYFRNKTEPRKILFNYDLYIDLKAPISKIRRERLTFLNPSEEFQKKLLKGGAVSEHFKYFLILLYLVPSSVIRLKCPV